MKLKANSIEIAVEKLRRAYLARGFIRINIIAKQESDPLARETCKITLKIEEDQPFRIHRIEFMGNEKTNYILALRATGLHLDQPYNPLQVEKWIQGLNRLGRFERIERKDVKISLDEQQHFVNILFTVR